MKTIILKVEVPDDAKTLTMHGTNGADNSKDRVIYKLTFIELQIPTEEEINKANRQDNSINDQFRKGAKWAINKMTV